MLIFKDHSWQKNSNYTDINYLADIPGAEQPKWVIPDNSELANKIMSTPYWEPVEDENGRLVDIVPVEPVVSDEESILLLKSRLEDLDRLAVRPLRAILTGNDVEEDRDVLADLEVKAQELREQISELEEKDNG